MTKSITSNTAGAANAAQAEMSSGSTSPAHEYGTVRKMFILDLHNYSNI